MMDPSGGCEDYVCKEIEASGDALALINEKIAEYTALQSSALAAARRGYVDDIIKAGETRQRVIAAFEMLFTKRGPSVQKAWHGLKRGDRHMRGLLKRAAAALLTAACLMSLRRPAQPPRISCRRSQDFHRGRGGR